MTDSVVKIPEYYERPQRVFGVWTLRKNKREAICEIVDPPDRWRDPCRGVRGVCAKRSRA
jgi:hypothetical protein